MSQKYDEFLEEHSKNIIKGCNWLINNLPEIFDNQLEHDVYYQCTFEHDKSKRTPEEYDAYDAYYYGNNKSYEVVQAYNLAWLTHLNRNKHHWQYWVLINDDPKEGEIILDMPDNYILEMICDWWSFSWKTNNLFEIFKWYNERKDYIKLSDRTRKKLENILFLMKEKLNETNKE